MPLFSPTILTINDLFLQLSGMQQADRMKMLFRLYELYKTRSGSDESFDDFLYWGEMLLNDFDDVDKYRVDARMLFANVTDLREMEQDFSYLTPEQVAAIRTFWSSFSPEGKSENQKQFLALWQILYDLYVDLRRVLADENCGYEGMIFREVVERLERNEGGDLPYEKVVFVGLNALSVTEECLLSQLHRRGIADFYWDYASPLVRDRDNKASYFVERNLERFPSAWPLPQEEEERERQIEVVGIPSGIGQAKQVYRILDAWCDEYEMDAEGALRTAVILPDEQLLIPVLNAIPERIRRINVTMGYPLSATPIASLVEYVLALQKNLRYVDAQPAFFGVEVEVGHDPGLQEVAQGDGFGKVAFGEFDDFLVCRQDEFAEDVAEEAPVVFFLPFFSPEVAAVGLEEAGDGHFSHDGCPVECVFGWFRWFSDSVV